MSGLLAGCGGIANRFVLANKMPTVAITSGVVFDIVRTSRLHRYNVRPTAFAKPKKGVFTAKRRRGTLSMRRCSLGRCAHAVRSAQNAEAMRMRIGRLTTGGCFGENA